MQYDAEPLEAKSVAQPSRAKDSKPTKVVRKRLKENSAKGSKKRPAEGQAQPAAGVTAKKSKKAETQGDTQQESPSAALTARKGPNSSRRQVLSDDTHVSPEPDVGPASTGSTSQTRLCLFAASPCCITTSAV